MVKYLHPRHVRVGRDACARNGLTKRTTERRLGVRTCGADGASDGIRLRPVFDPSFSKTRRAFVVHGANGWDEATPICPFTLIEVQDGSIQERTLGPQDHGLPACSAEDLQGGDARYNAMRLRRVLEGREFGAHRNALLLGTGLALEVTGRAASLKEGIQQANAALDAGKGTQLLSRLALPTHKGVVNG